MDWHIDWPKKKFATPTLTTDLSEAIKDRELGLQI